MSHHMSWSEFVQSLHPDNRYVVEERAAIREYDANMPRDKAEAITMAEYQEQQISEINEDDNDR